MWVDDSERPNFWDGQYLGPSDFVATVEYGREARRRLNLGQHAWGIFGGLDIVDQARAGSSTTVDLFISPGFAVDGFGREMVVCHPIALSPELFQRYVSEKWVQVWLRYDALQINPPMAGFETCDDPDAPYRTLETVKIELGETSRLHDPIQVDGKPIDETQYPSELSVPFQALPDDDELTSSWWLVPIGYVHWNGADGFIKAADEVDRTKQRTGRVYGGDVAAHTYAPDGTWELVAGLLVPQDPNDENSPKVLPLVDATVRGKLTVTDLLVAKSRVRLDGGPLSFAAINGDETVPITLTRTGKATDPGAALTLTIGSKTDGSSRFEVQSAGPGDCFSITDAGDVVVGHDLVVRNGLTTQRNEKDTYVLSGVADSANAVALGLEASSQVLYARAPGGLRVYLDETTANNDHQVFQADSFGVRVRQALVVGWGGDSHVQTRHVIGKASGNDGVDDLFLNWENGKNVHVGGPGTRSDLHVSGDVYVAGNLVPLTTPIDVQAGLLSTLMPGFFPVASVSGTWVRTHQASSDPGAGPIRTFRVKSNLANVGKTPQVTLGLTSINNLHTATDAFWGVWATPLGPVDPQTWEFQFNWAIVDDGGIFDASYTVVFYP